MIAGLAGLAALGSLALTTRTYRLTQQGQFADRYTKAIAQLGDDKLDVRLGGIYALERIAVDSKRDHPTVVEVLSVYVRERSTPIQRTRPIGHRTAHPPILGKYVKLAVDVQAALTVLGRLPHRSGVSRGDLYGANLTEANLYGANLTEANLRRVNLTEADLGGGANLTDADLSCADLTKAHLDCANLTDAHLYGAKLTEADLALANLTKANLGGANLTGVKNLSQCQVNSAFGNESTQLPAELRHPDRWRSESV